MKRGRLTVAVVILTLTLVGSAAPPGAAPGATERGVQTDVLQQEIQTVLQSRDAALRTFQERYAAAALADRVALEREGAELTEEYERAYLELLVQYHTLTGNTAEAERANLMLERIMSGPVTGTPLNLNRNLPEPEGGQQHER